MNPGAQNVGENACYWQEMLLSLNRSEICLLGVFWANWWVEWGAVCVAQRRGLRRGRLMLQRTLAVESQGIRWVTRQEAKVQLLLIEC